MKFISPVSILELMIKNPDWFDWEPETIWRDIDNMYPDLPEGSPEFPGQFKNIVMAIKLCFSNNMPWEEWNIFNQVVLAFNNQIPMFETYMKPSLGEIAYAVYVMNKIKEEKFGVEIEGFIASIAKEEGLLILPDNLDFAKEDLALLNRGFENKAKASESYWRLCSIKGALPENSNEDNFILVQCARLMAIRKYVDSKVQMHKEGNIVKLGGVLGDIKSSISNVGEIARLGYSKYAITKEQRKEMAKYVHLTNRKMAIEIVKHGIILSDSNVKFRTMDDDSIANGILELTGKPAEKIGSIYKRVYKLSSGVLSRTVGRIGYGLSSAASRMGNFLGDNLFKKDKGNK